ncbi:MAG: ABC transporter ATP-binding protein [Peptococcaceae bacterium]|jgi:iron complex transport system ATP-binding protein|nr:ABC transporter ATP-binding protein [Peptococcaceae bacterium]
MEDKATFRVEGLSFAYAANPVLRDLSFTIPQGKISTLMGANGCGKTTLFNLMTKNLRPQAGRILLDGEDITTIRLRAFSQRVATLHQSNTAPPDLTVQRLVEYGRTPHRGLVHFAPEFAREKDRSAVEQALVMTGLSALAGQSLGELSGGQRQRAFLAMAIAQEPQILFLDEPTTYLDVRYQIEILRFIRVLNREQGITILMVLHDINQALHYSDEILAVSPQGQLLTQGEPQQVITPELLLEMYGISLEITEFRGKPFVPSV